jgi:hypothetical protein
VPSGPSRGQRRLVRAQPLIEGLLEAVASPDDFGRQPALPIGRQLIALDELAGQAYRSQFGPHAVLEVCSIVGHALAPGLDSARHPASKWHATPS